MRYCVVGDSGLLGQALVRAFAKDEGGEVLGLSTSAFSPAPYQQRSCGKYRHEICNILHQREWFLYLLDTFQPELVVNCTALADLGDCEKDPVLAERLNTEVPGWLARVCAVRKIGFVHFLTDQIFDGRKGSGYTEEDAPNPLTVYGRTKLKGERLVLENYPAALVLRTNIVGFRDRVSQPTFAEWLSGSLVRKEPITLFEDYVTSSIHTEDLAEILMSAVRKGLRGAWHAAAHDSASKYKFGTILAEKAGLDLGRVKKGRLADADLIPPRPPFLALDVSRLEKELGRKFPSVADTVDRLVQDIQARGGSGK